MKTTLAGGKLIVTIPSGYWKYANLVCFILVDIAEWRAITTPMASRAFDVQKLAQNGYIRLEGFPIKEIGGNRGEFPGKSGLLISLDIGRHSPVLRAQLEHNQPFRPGDLA